MLRTLYAPYGTQDGDIESVPLGVTGVDVVLSPLAKSILHVFVECKACESINLSTEFQEHLNKYSNKEGLKLLVHSRNHIEPVVMLTLKDFSKLLESHLAARCRRVGTKERSIDPSLTPLLTDTTQN